MINSMTMVWNMIKRERYYKTFVRHILCGLAGINIALAVQLVTHHTSRVYSFVLAMILYIIIFYRSYEVVRV